MIREAKIDRKKRILMQYCVVATYNVQHEWILDLIKRSTALILYLANL